MAGIAVAKGYLKPAYCSTEGSRDMGTIYVP